MDELWQQQVEEQLDMNIREAEREYELSLKDSHRRQVGGNHYKRMVIEPWTIIDTFDLNFYEGNVLKYLLRKKENRVEDLEKAIHYLEKEIENEHTRKSIRV